MNFLKKTGAFCFGAFEGISIVLLISLICRISLTGFSYPIIIRDCISTGWCIFGGLLGAFICAVDPDSSLIYTTILMIISALSDLNKRSKVKAKNIEMDK